MALWRLSTDATDLGLFGGDNAAAAIAEMNEGCDPQIAAADVRVARVRQSVRCECPARRGPGCAWEGDADAVVTVEWVPEGLRDALVEDHGTYPDNGARRIRCSPACASDLVAADEGWTRVVV